MALKASARSASATVAFAPSGQFLAAGSMAGAIDQSFDSSSSLEILKLDFESESLDMPVLGSCTTSEKFNRLSWSSVGTGSEEYPYGVIAGGLTDGTVNLFNPAALVSGDAAKASSARFETKSKHKNAVRGLEFNPIEPHNLASGGNEGHIHIWNLTNPASPQIFPALENPYGEITDLAWNRGVSAIFANTSGDGHCVVWDLRRKTHVIKFLDRNRKKFSLLQWSPEVNTQLIVASDDTSPALQVWDLRNYVSPSKEIPGHSQGVLSMAWCPHDSSLLLTSAKDYKTFCWDTESGEVVHELPSTSQWTSDVQWSPHTPGVLSTSSFDGSLTIWNIEACNGTQSAASEFGSSFAGVAPAVVKKAPKWLKRPVGVSFGFGGKLVSFVPKKVQLGAPPTTEIRLHSVITEEGLVKRSTEFEAAITVKEKSALFTFCESKSVSSGSEEEKETWSFLKVMFEEDARQRLLSHLDFEVNENGDNTESSRAPEDVVSEEFAQNLNLNVHDGLTDNRVETLPTASSGQPLSLNGGSQLDDADDFFNNIQTPRGTLSENASRVESLDSVSEHTGEEHTEAEEERDAVDAELEAAIQKALVVGNFPKAVDHCLKANKMADALILAFVSGGDLWDNTRNNYVKQSHRPYLKIVSGVINNDLRGLVESRPLKAWRETLALLCTYARSDEWTQLADLLAGKLDGAHETQAATLCYICAGNIERAVEIWSRDLEVSSVGKNFVDRLQDLMEKTVVLFLATGQSMVSAALARLFGTYAELLASQGLVDTALKYLSFVSDEHSGHDLAILRDRLSSCGQGFSGAAHPAVPVEGGFQPEPVEATQHVPSPASEETYQPVAAPAPASGYGYGHQYGQPSVQGYAKPPYQARSQPQPQNIYSTVSGPTNYNEPVRQAVQPTSFLIPDQAKAIPGPSYTSPSPTPFQPAPVPFQPAPVPFQPAPVPFQPAPIPFHSAPNPYSLQPTILKPSAQVHGFEPKQGPVVRNVPSPSSTMGWENPAAHGPPTTSPLLHSSAPKPSAVLYPMTSQPSPQIQQIHPIQPESPPAVIAPPAPPPTVQSVDTSNVAAELKPVVATLTKLFNETSEAIGGSRANPKSKREIEDNSKKLGALFLKLNVGDISPNASAKLIQLCQYLHTGDYVTASQIQVQLTTSDWDECSFWLTALRRMIKARQTFR